MSVGKRRRYSGGVTTLTMGSVLGMAGAAWAGAAEKSHMVCIMGNDIGRWNLGVSSRGMTFGKTPNLDTLASQGDRHA